MDKCYNHQLWYKIHIKDLNNKVWWMRLSLSNNIKQMNYPYETSFKSGFKSCDFTFVQ